MLSSQASCQEFGQSTKQTSTRYDMPNLMRTYERAGGGVEKLAKPRLRNASHKTFTVRGEVGRMRQTSRSPRIVTTALLSLP